MERGAAGAMVATIVCGAGFIPPSWTNGPAPAEPCMGSGAFAFKYFSGSTRNFSAHPAQQK
jgi:hypothetical protein